MVKYARDPINESLSCKARGRYVQGKKIETSDGKREMRTSDVDGRGRPEIANFHAIGRLSFFSLFLILLASFLRPDRCWV